MSRAVNLFAAAALLAAAATALLGLARLDSTEAAEKGTCAAALCGHVIF